MAKLVNLSSLARIWMDLVGISDEIIGFISLRAIFCDWAAHVAGNHCLFVSNNVQNILHDVTTTL